MKTLNKIGLMTVLLGLGVSAVAETFRFTPEQLSTAAQLGKTASESDLAYKLDESLTTEVGARRVGTPADGRAVQWAVAKMNSLGFDKVWTEKVVTPGWHRGDINISVSSPYPQRLVAITLGDSVGTPKGGINAEIVYFASVEELEKAQPNSLNGKIAYIGKKMQPSIDGAGYGSTGKQRWGGGKIAEAKGAAALLIRSVGTDHDRIGHTGSQQGRSNIPAAALSSPDADLVENMLKRGKPVTIQLEITAKRIKDVVTYNVIGEVTGRNKPEDFVVLGSHLDSWDVGTGAIDDGMGVTITMAAAKHIIDSGQKPSRSIRVILFAAEEIGLYGVKQYAEAHKEGIKHHLIGAEWDSGVRAIHQIRPGVGPKSLAAIKQLAKLMQPYGVSLHNSNTAKGQSDISVLGDAGMPAINFDSDLSDYFDYHHTENDTMANVPPATMKQASAIYTIFAWLAADSDIDFRK